MTIQINKTDRNGKPISIGSVVQVWNWDLCPSPLGTAEVIWDNDEGRVSLDPPLVTDPYDLWSQALPRCEVIG